MRFTRWLIPIAMIVALALILVATVASAAPPDTTAPGPTYSIAWDVLASGSQTMRSDSFILMGTVGQPATGNMASSSYMIQTGYWAGVWPYRHTLLPFLGK